MPSPMILQKEMETTGDDESSEEDGDVDETMTKLWSLVPWEGKSIMSASM